MVHTETENKQTENKTEKTENKDREIIEKALASGMGLAKVWAWRQDDGWTPREMS
jgi:hypothetical protein